MPMVSLEAAAARHAARPLPKSISALSEELSEASAALAQSTRDLDCARMKLAFAPTSA